MERCTSTYTSMHCIRHKSKVVHAVRVTQYDVMYCTYRFTHTTWQVVSLCLRWYLCVTRITTSTFSGKVFRYTNVLTNIVRMHITIHMLHAVSHVTPRVHTKSNYHTFTGEGYCG